MVGGVRTPVEGMSLRAKEEGQMRRPSENEMQWEKREEAEEEEVEGEVEGEEGWGEVVMVQTEEGDWSKEMHKMEGLGVAKLLVAEVRVYQGDLG